MGASCWLLNCSTLSLHPHAQLRGAAEGEMTPRGPGVLFCQHLYPKELAHFVCVYVIRGDAGVEGNAKQQLSLVV